MTNFTVQSIASTVSEPRSVQHIAEEACVSEVTAQECLTRLADLGVVLDSEQDGSGLFGGSAVHSDAGNPSIIKESHGR